MIFNLNYLLIMGETLIFREIESKWYKDAWKWFVGLTFIQLALIASIRNISVGTDTQNYIWMFCDAQNGITTDYIELGSRLYILFLGRLTTNDTFFLAAWAVPTIALFYRYMIRNSEDIYLSVCIYASLMYYFLLFNMLRQAMAIGIVLQAIEPLKQKKYFWYLLIVLAAMLVHTSAAVFLLVFLIGFSRIKLDMPFFILVAFLCALFAIAGRKIIVVGAELIGYGGYLNTGFAGNGNVLHPILFLFLLFLCMILILCRNTKKIFREGLEYKMLVVGTMFYWLSIQVQIVNRIPYYFTGVLLTMLPNLIHDLRDRKQAEIVKFSVVIFLLLYEILMVRRSAHGIVPYRFIWE